MRLTDNQIQEIKKQFSYFFPEKSNIWLFGSRVDNSKKGGDIDLYIETELIDIEKIYQNKIYFLSKLKLAFGERKIDVIINILNQTENLPIYDEAKKTGVRL